MKSSVRYAIISLLKDIINSYGIISDNSCENYIHEKGPSFEYYNEKGKIEKGVTKLCLIFDSMPEEVVKIPIVHSLGRKVEGHIKYKNNIFNELAKLYESGEDLCLEETSYYDLAVEAGIQEYFAKEKRIMVFYGIPVYVQERVKCNYTNRDKEATKINKTVRAETYFYIKELGYGSEDAIIDLMHSSFSFLANIYKIGGKEKLKKVLDFIICNDIDDLHVGNIGYTYNNTPIFFDYSGFC